MNDCEDLQECGVRFVECCGFILRGLCNFDHRCITISCVITDPRPFGHQLHVLHSFSSFSSFRLGIFSLRLHADLFLSAALTHLITHPQHGHRGHRPPPPLLFSFHFLLCLAFPFLFSPLFFCFFLLYFPGVFLSLSFIIYFDSFSPLYYSSLLSFLVLSFLPSPLPFILSSFPLLCQSF